MAIIVTNEGYRISTWDLLGKTVTDARTLYQSRLGIPDQATAVLNNSGISSQLEIRTVLSNHDNLVFKLRNLDRTTGYYLRI